MKWGEFSDTSAADSFDLIVGSDIIYSEAVVKPLAETIRHFLKQDSGTAFIANNKIRYDY